MAHYVKAGFSDFKIKLSGDRTRDLAKVNALAALGLAPQAVRADANNLWADAAAAIGDLKALGFPFSAVEEPLRAGDYAGMRQIASALDTKIILDESLLRQDQLALMVKRQIATSSIFVSRRWAGCCVHWSLYASCAAEACP